MLSVMIRGTGGRRAALGKQIELLRQGQRLSMEAAAVKARISATTWRRVERGQGVHGLTYRAVEETLGLRRGVIDEYLAKKAPLEALDRQAATAPKNGMLEHLDHTPHLTEQEKRALKRFAQALREDEQNTA